MTESAVLEYRHECDAVRDHRYSVQQQDLECDMALINQFYATLSK